MTRVTIEGAGKPIHGSTTPELGMTHERPIGDRRVFVGLAERGAIDAAVARGDKLRVVDAPPGAKATPLLDAIERFFAAGGWGTKEPKKR